MHFDHARKTDETMIPMWTRASARRETIDDCRISRHATVRFIPGVCRASCPRARASLADGARLASTICAAAPGALAPGAPPPFALMRAHVHHRPRPSPVAGNPRPRSSGDGVEKDVPAEDRVVVEFWHLWGGGADGCRAYVVGAERGSVYRDPARMESASAPSRACSTAAPAWTSPRA